MRTILSSILATTILMGALPSMAENLSHVEKLKATKKCEDCDLRGANLTNANLRGVHLADTNLKNANMTDADLTGAILEYATFCKTTMPDRTARNGNC